MKNIPNRSKSGKKFAAILFLYTAILSVIFVNWQSGEPGPISIGLAIGCVIGVMREASLRMKYKKAVEEGRV